MKDINLIIACLKASPLILKGMLDEIPEELYKTRRIKGKWNIHEHVCHLADVQPMLIERFQKFRDEQFPTFVPFLPGENLASDDLIEKNFDEAVSTFQKLRYELVDLVASSDKKTWGKKANHPEYATYTPYILLRHILTHDHLHMYRMEELWLTNESYLAN